MSGAEWYYAERQMKNNVREAHQEAEVFRPWQESKTGTQGWLAGVGSHLFGQLGHRLQRLGAWLEERGEEAFDGQMTPAP